MALTKRQITKAARIYLLAATANMDQLGAETDDERAVVEAAIAIAVRELAKLGVDVRNVGTLPQCLVAAAA